MRGFGVRVKPSGVASWLVQYRNAEGRTRRLVIGKIGAVPPHTARRLARDHLSAVANGKDPSAARHALREAMAVGELCDLYLKEAKATGRIKTSTLAMDRSRIERHVKPLLGNRSVRSLSPRDLARFQADVANGRTAKRRPEKGRTGRTIGGRGVAGRTLGMLGTILEFALRQQLIERNPARQVERIPDGRRQRFLSHEELKRLGQALHAANTDGSPATSGAVIGFLLLTGCRRMEALALPWVWVDREARCLRLLESKSGAQLRPLGKTALQLLDRQPRRAGCPFVFPSEKGDPKRHFVGAPRVLERLCNQAGIAPVVSLHVLRHTFAAVAAELGFSELTIAGLLGHRVSGITARYAHMPDRALLTAADQVSARLAFLLGEV
jgi:integrase